MQEKSTMFYLGALPFSSSSPVSSHRRILLSSLLLIFLSYSPVEETRGVLMTREMDVRTRNLVHSASQQEHYVLYGAGGLRARGDSLPPTHPPSIPTFSLLPRSTTRRNRNPRRAEDPNGAPLPSTLTPCFYTRIVKD